MDVDWPIVAIIAAPILAVVVGIALDRFFERRPRIVAYYAHASVFQVAGQTPIRIHTHSIVIRNTGRKPAEEVRVTHNTLPLNVNVYPDMEYEKMSLPGGGTDLIFPTLVPGQQVSISYLYFPPLLYSHIHGGIRHREGFATEITLLPTPQYPNWFLQTLRVLVLLGLIAACYIVFAIGRVVVRLIGF